MKRGGRRETRRGLGWILDYMDKFTGSVVIGCDLISNQTATTLRVILEQWCIRVHLVNLVYEQHIKEFLGGQIPRCDYTILCCHGMGETEAQTELLLRCLHNLHNDYTRKDGWEEKILRLTPQNIGEYLGTPEGTFINLACGGGRQVWANAFLDVGYQGYIGADRDYIDTNASVLFIAGFFYHLLMHTCDYTEQRFTPAEAVQAAAGMDKHYQWGTQLFRFYSRDL